MTRVVHREGLLWHPVCYNAYQEQSILWRTMVDGEICLIRSSGKEDELLTGLQEREVRKTMPTIVKDLTLYSVFDVSRMLNVTTVSVRNYIKQGHLNGQKLMGRWFVTEDDLNTFFDRLI